MTDSPERRDVRAGWTGLAVALLCGVGLMAPLLNAGPLALDEHGSYWLVASDLPGSVLQRSLDYAAIPPLSAWLEQTFLLVFGQSEFTFRLPSALCYLAAIVVAWFVAAELADRNAATGAALLLAWHPDLDEVRIARCYGLLMLLSALLLWCTVRWRRSPRSLAWPVAWSLVAAALMWTHYVALPLIGMAGLTLLVPWESGPQPRIHMARVIGGGGLFALLCLPLVPAVLRLREWSPVLNYMPEGQPWWKMLGPLWWAGAPAGLALAWLLRRRGPPSGISLKRVLLPALWTLVPLVVIVLMARGDLSSLANPRYRIPYAAAGACLIAVALRAVSPRRVTNIAAAITVIGLTWSLAEARPWQLRRLGAPADAEWRAAADAIREIGSDGEPVFVQSGLVESYLVPALYEDAVFLEYVGCRISRFYLESPHPRIGMPYFWDAPAEMRSALRARMSPETVATESFWVAAATDTDLNRTSLAGIDQLARSSGFIAVHEQRGPNMTLLRYQHPAEHP